MSIKNNVLEVKNTINDTCEKIGRDASNIHIVGVTKYVDENVAQDLVNHGIVNLGENRPDNFLEKRHTIDGNVLWHFIGTLQSRKVKSVIHDIDFLHSLDRLSLAMEIEKHAPKLVNCFVQVNVSNEESKHGLSLEEVIPFIRELSKFSKIKVVGLMTMAPYTDDEELLRQCFKSLKNLQLAVLDLNLEYAPCTELSMGMSNDYKIAIEEGATYVRLGSVLTN